MGDFNLGDKVYLVRQIMRHDGHRTFRMAMIENTMIHQIVDTFKDGEIKRDYRVTSGGLPFYHNIREDEKLFATNEEAQDYAEILNKKYKKEEQELKKKREQENHQSAVTKTEEILTILRENNKELNKDSLIWLYENDYITSIE